MFCEGRQFEKNTSRCKNIHLFLHRDFTKNRQKSAKKSRNAAFATRTGKKAFPGAPFFAKNGFLVDLGVPEETQKLVKMSEGH